MLWQLPVLQRSINDKASEKFQNEEDCSTATLYAAPIFIIVELRIAVSFETHGIMRSATESGLDGRVHLD